MNAVRPVNISRLSVNAVIIAAAMASPCYASTLKVSAMLGDNAVLQRDIPVPVWGQGTPGARIVASLSGRIVYARVKKDGTWRLEIGPFESGELGDLMVKMGKEAAVSRNLAAGEVWFCSGQSNMALATSGCSAWEDEKKVCADPMLRLLTVPNDVALSPLRDSKAVWKPADESSAGQFSGLGYYFGKKLRRELGVPVGIIASSWGATMGEAWMPMKDLKGGKDFMDILVRWKKRVAREPRIAVKETPFKLEVSAVSLVPADGSAPVPLNMAGSATVPVWSEPITSDNSRAEFRISNGTVYFSGNLGISGWATVNRPIGTYDKPEDYSRFEAIRLRVRGKGVMNIQVRATDVWDWAFHISKPFKVTPKWTEVTLKFSDFGQADWGWKKPLNTGVVFGLDLSADTGMTTPEMPAGIFNGMVGPVIPHAIRGILWYQGESNADRAEQYRKLLPALINGWRREWGQSDIPFYVVQLANYGKACEGAEDSDWAEVREAQALAMSLSNTGLATAIDIGEAENIHPRNKQELARRLSLVALANIHGKQVEYSGPAYKSSSIDGGKITVTFSHSTGMKPREGEVLRGFAVAGSDRVFHPSRAAVSGDSVVVECPAVPVPASVRYSWAQNPAGNLVNASGLPALPFRSDDWKLTTAGKR